MLSIKSGFRMHFSRWFKSAFVLCIALAIAGCGGGGGESAQGDISNQVKMAKAVVRASNVTVTNMTLVSSTRVGRTVFNYDYQITVQNNGYTPLTGVTATLTGVGAGTTIINGAVQVGDLAAGATVTTQGTITLQQDRTIPFNQAALVWSFTNTVTSVPVVVLTQPINVADGATINVQAPGNPLNGTIINIPPNAIGTSGTDTISIGYSDTLPGPINPTAVSAGAKVVSKVVQLTHTSTADFTDSLTVTIPYDTVTVGPNEVPVVLYWDETLNGYQAVKVISFDRAAGTITFRTHHFTTFIVVHIKGLYVALSSTSILPYVFSTIPSKFQPNQDGFAVANFSSATGASTGGACYGLSAFAVWNFAAHNLPLFTNYFGSTNTNPLVSVSNILEQDLARELIYATFHKTLNQSQIVANDVTKTPVTKIDEITAFTLISNLLITNTPQMLDLFQYRNYANVGYAHSVVVYAWDAAQGFSIYDPNLPGVLQRINFQWPQFSPYAYRGLSFTLFSTDAPGSFYSSSDLSNLYSNASIGSENYFSNRVSVLSTIPAQPSGLPAKTYAIDATNSTVINAQTIIPPIDVSLNPPAPMALSAFVYIDDVPIAPATVAADGTFSVQIPPLSSGKTSEELLIIVADSSSVPDTNKFSKYVGVLRANLSVSSLPFFSDDFNGTALDTTKWSGVGGTISENGGFVQFNAYQRINTQGKLTLSGSKIVIETRMAGQGPSRDTSIDLFDTASPNDFIVVGETSYNGWGYNALANGAYNFLEYGCPVGAGSCPSNIGVLGSSTNQFMEYRMTYAGNKLTIERGPTLTNITQTMTRTLGQSIVGHSFYLNIGTGDVNYSPGTIDWIRVYTY